MTAANSDDCLGSIKMSTGAAVAVQQKERRKEGKTSENLLVGNRAVIHLETGKHLRSKVFVVTFEVVVPLCFSIC